MSEAGRCPECGSPLQDEFARGLCPRCLMGFGLAASGGETETASVLGPKTRVSERKDPRFTDGDDFGHFRIVRLLGQGGMGEVYEAEDLESGRRVAIKVMAHTLASDEHRDRFLREGRLAASINHPNSVYVFGTEEIDGIPVISMELSPGGTLEDRIRDAGPMDPATAVDAALDLIEGPSSRARQGHPPPGHQAIQLLCRSRRAGQGRRLRSVDLDKVGRNRPDRCRYNARDTGLCLTRATQGRGSGRPVGYLLPGCDAVLPSDRAAAVRRDAGRQFDGRDSRADTGSAAPASAEGSQDPVAPRPAMPVTRARGPICQLRRSAGGAPALQLSAIGVRIARCALRGRRAGFRAGGTDL